jgi:hypothetical protein
VADCPTHVGFVPDVSVIVGVAGGWLTVTVTGADVAGQPCAFRTVTV